MLGFFGIENCLDFGFWDLELIDDQLIHAIAS